ncbi:MAG: hypothetical protein ACE5HF_08650 [Gemmatimonadota bacterium]
MKRLGFLFAGAAFLLVPATALAQDEAEGPPPTSIVTVTSFHVPLGPERGKVLQFIEKVVAPQARNNPNVLAFYVLQHNWGSDSRDVKLVSVYADMAAVDAPCGEPCQTWADENLPEEGEEGYEEFDELADNYLKYFGKHSDEIYISRMDLAKD